MAELCLYARWLDTHIEGREGCGDARSTKSPGQGLPAPLTDEPVAALEVQGSASERGPRLPNAFPHGINGPGATPGEGGMACTSQPSPCRTRHPEGMGRSRQRPQAPARHGRHGALAANAMNSATCEIDGVSHPSAIIVHNDPNVTCALWIGNGTRPRAVKSRARGSGSNATPNGRRSSLPEPWIGAYPPSRPSGGGRLGSRPFPRPPRRPCRRWHSRCA